MTASGAIAFIRMPVAAPAAPRNSKTDDTTEKPMCFPSPQNLFPDLISPWCTTWIRLKTTVSTITSMTVIIWGGAFNFTHTAWTTVLARRADRLLSLDKRCKSPSINPPAGTYVAQCGGYIHVPKASKSWPSYSPRMYLAMRLRPCSSFSTWAVVGITQVEHPPLYHQIRPQDLLRIVITSASISVRCHHWK